MVEFYTVKKKERITLKRNQENLVTQKTVTTEYVLHNSIYMGFKTSQNASMVRKLRVDFSHVSLLLISRNLRETELCQGFVHFS